MSDTPSIFRFTPGDAPLVVSMPHVGTRVPEDIAARFTDAATALPDTDWHVDRLYDFLDELGATVIAAAYSRYVVDLNRPPDGAVLYPGASNTGLCPKDTFDEAPIYRDGRAPDDAEVAARREAYWRPYHDRLAQAVAETRDRHGVALLWDAHSIRSHVPRFFDGRLPDLNFGTGGGVSADPGLVDRLRGAAAAFADYDHVVDGRFKGGYITRSNGDPARGIHAVQLELSQATYMDEAPPYAFDEALAGGIRPVLRRLLVSALDWVTMAGR